MTLFIDGDACPVKAEIYKIAKVYQLPVTMVTSFSHHSNEKLADHVTIIYVDEGADSADFRLVALIKKEDILITQDYGLASLVLGIGARVLHHSGNEYTPETIDRLLESRYLSAQMRRSGQRTKGPKKFTTQNKKDFTDKLIQIINERGFEKEDKRL